MYWVTARPTTCPNDDEPISLPPKWTDHTRNSDSSAMSRRAAAHTGAVGAGSMVHSGGGLMGFVIDRPRSDGELALPIVPLIFRGHREVVAFQIKEGMMEGRKHVII